MIQNGTTLSVINGKNINHFAYFYAVGAERVLTEQLKIHKLNVNLKPQTNLRKI